VGSGTTRHVISTQQYVWVAFIHGRYTIKHAVLIKFEEGNINSLLSEKKNIIINFHFQASKYFLLRIIPLIF